MNLPDLSSVEIPKRMLGMLIGIFFIKDTQNLYMACILAALLVVGVAAQTYTDIKGKNNKNP